MPFLVTLISDLPLKLSMVPFLVKLISDFPLVNFYDGISSYINFWSPIVHVYDDILVTLISDLPL